MIKSFAALFLLLSASCLAGAQGPVNVKMTVPQRVNAGEDFQVRVVIEKGSLEEFSRFQQELPAGLSATQENSGSADFSFEEQRVRFIWLKLPDDPSIEISYRITVNERLKGSFTLFGEFSYVDQDERRSIIIDREEVEILPSPAIAAEDQVDINDFASVMAAEREAKASATEVTCIRQTPFQSTTGNDILVHLLVYKKEMSKFAKIEEVIPDGFTARSMESEDGLFTFKDGIAKFVWMNLPEAPGFRISYRLLPAEGKTIEDLSIDGTLTYIEGGRNIDVPVVQYDLDLSAVNQSNMEDVIASVKRGEPPVLASQPDRASAETSQTPERTTVGPSQPPDRTTMTDRQNPPVDNRSPAGNAASGKIPANLLLPVADGYYFRVQLAATRNYNPPKEFALRYSLTRPILIEKHQGYFKYTIGSFSSYSQAQAVKNSMLRRGIRGAFIVSYRNGNRIDIMDALQATGGR